MFFKNSGWEDCFLGEKEDLLHPSYPGPMNLRLIKEKADKLRAI
jgi:hypothetical protein